MRYFIVRITLLFLFLPSISFADAEKIFKENSRAVVVIISYDSEGNPIGHGSGFVVREDGAVVTNYHVISSASDIRIKAGDEMFKVDGLLHIDKENDAVILKADAKALLAVKLGDINKANVGENVYVISSPQGLENTISDGILSGIREITPERKILQITAPVSEGSSGAPVFNENGEVIGIATFIIKEAQNLNLAIPVNLVKDKISSKKVTALKDAGIIDYKKTAGYWFILGYYYEEAGLYNDAIEAYTSAIALNPNFADAYNSRGIAYADGGEYDKAIEDYNRAIALEKNYAQAYNNRGITYGRKGQYDRAIEDYNRAIALNQNYADAYNYRGFAYYRKGIIEGAISDFQKACDLGLEAGCKNLKKDLKNRYEDEEGLVKSYSIGESQPSLKKPYLSLLIILTSPK